MRELTPEERVEQRDALDAIYAEIPAQRQPSDDELAAMYTGNPVIDRAEAAVRAFHVESRADAARILQLWQHNPELSERERAAVLARFADLPATPSDDELAAMYTGNPVIDNAERALRDFGVHLRTAAKVCLPYWRYADTLTEREFAAVVARFPEHGSVPRLAGGP